MLLTARSACRCLRNRSQPQRCKPAAAGGGRTFAAGGARRDGRRTPRQQQQEQQEQQQEQQEPKIQRSDLRFDFLVTCHPGLESAVAEELQAPQIGAEEVEAVEPGRVAFRFSNPVPRPCWRSHRSAASQETGQRACLWLRGATRVLQLIAAEPLDPRYAAGDTVYEATRALVDWPTLLSPGATVGVTGQVWSCSNISNSQLVAKRVRDAVCDAVRDARGSRPPPPGDAGPDLPLHASLIRDTLKLYRDLGGGSLHRRGYREGTAIHKAALNEAAAAGLLLVAGWHRKCGDDGVFADPMCGSGTFLIEAGLIATNTAPGLLRGRARPFAFEGWHDFQAGPWRAAVEGARAAARPWAGALLGNDLHGGALKLAQAALETAGLMSARGGGRGSGKGRGGVDVSLHAGACGAWRPPRVPTFVASNPPWGGRLLPGEFGAAARQRGGGGPPWRDAQGARGQGGVGGGDAYAAHAEEDEGDLVAAWEEVAAFLRSQAPGAEAWLLSGAPELTRALNMRSFKKRAITLGGVKAAWLGYEVLPPRQQ